MTSFLVTYGTELGQTAKVANHIDSVLTDRGHDVTTRHVTNTADLDVEAFDGVLVGAAVYNQGHQPVVRAFIEEHRDALATRPSGFFQLSMASALPWAEAREGARDYVDALTAQTGWAPDRVGLFGGAVNYPAYGRLTRVFFKLVSMVSTGDTDTSREYEYTDWDAVERFAVEFADFAADREGPAAGEAAGVARVVGGLSGRESLALALLGLGAAGAVYWLTRARDRPAPDWAADHGRDVEVASESPDGIESRE